MRTLFLPLLTVACVDPVLISGIVDESPADGAGPLVGGLVTMLDRTGERLEIAATDDEGHFELELERPADLYALVENDDGIISSFTGSSGFNPTLELPDGELFAVPEQQRADWRALFAGCEHIDEGGLIVGQVHVFLPGVTPDESTIVVTAEITAFSSEDESPDAEGRAACYLDDEGTGYDPSAEVTGPTGFYAIGGVEPGAQDLVVSFAITETVSGGNVLSAWMPADGVVARLPTFVDFPFDP